MAVIAVSGCSRAPAPEPQTESAIEASAEAQFIGSQACADCHEDAYRDWQGSHHELAMQVADKSTILGDFDDAVFDYYGNTTRFTMRDGEYIVHTDDANGEEREFRVKYTFGVTPLQQYLVEFPGGRMQALPFTWDARSKDEGGQRWYHLYPDEYIGPGDILHWTGRLQNWNYMCAECHSTNLVAGYDADTRSYNTTYSEISVGCEACHGPGSTHRDRAAAGTLHQESGLPVSLDDRANSVWVMNADSGIAERSRPPSSGLQQPESCGRCHSRRGVIAPDYEYGEPLDATHRLALLDEHLYFADGQIKDEVYVYGSFVQSRMYRAGVTCSDCHNPHSGELVTESAPSDVCTQCHLPTKYASADHSHHEPAEAACVDCHMTSRVYMGVDERRDHSFRVPRPDLTIEIGSPNACNDCHGEQSPAWAASQIAEWTGPEASPRPHIGTALAAGRRGPANKELADAAMNASFPSISRATALTMLTPPFDDEAIGAIAAALEAPDPLMRRAAVEAMQLASAETRLRLGAQTLNDPVLSVRMATARAFADLRDLLPATDARTFGPAMEEYRESHKARFDTPEALASLGNFELTMGDVDAAIDYFEQSLQLEPGNALLHHSMGLVLVRAGRHDAALEELRQAHELEPSDPRYVYVYGVALNSLGLNNDALKLLQNARTQFPADYDIGWAIATMLRDAGDVDAASEVADELAAQFPGNANIAALLRELNSE